MYRQFVACVPYRELEIKYRRAFRYCEKHIHHLPYRPRKRNSPLCENATNILRKFIRENNIDIVLYKGGNVEHKLCNDACVSSLDIERLGAPKVYSHDLRVEVKEHYNYLVRNILSTINEKI